MNFCFVFDVIFMFFCYTIYIISFSSSSERWSCCCVTGPAPVLSMTLVLTSLVITNCHLTFITLGKGILQSNLIHKIAEIPKMFAVVKKNGLFYTK